jgi:putative phosphoribosyl transferase
MLRDRSEAGRILARKLQHYANRPDVLVLALPRGGVPVAFEVARALHVPLDVFLVRKLGMPGYEEIAAGALASGGLRVLNLPLIEVYSVTEREMGQIIQREKAELDRQERLYRSGQPPLDVRGKVVILVDDGLATGSTMKAAVLAVKQGRPARIVVAVPVAPPDTCESLRAAADAVFCPLTPTPFESVSRWYSQFDQTSDAEVRELLQRARQPRAPLRLLVPAEKPGPYRASGM